MSGNNKHIRPLIVNGIGDIEKSIKVLEWTISILDKANIKYDAPYLFSPVYFNHSLIQYKKINYLNYAQYNDFIIKLGDIWPDDSYALVCQNDGFPINHNIWDDAFLDYDYIGSPWNIDKPHHKRVGNGGFSLRSPYFLKVVSSVVKCNGTPEDTRVCESYGDILRDKYGIKFAPINIAMKFSFEHYILERKDMTLDQCFGMHDFTVGPKEQKEKYKKICNAGIL
jgi:hypothetical protein